jgi:PIN domain nuclease of toxin-antitoxin system
VVKRVLVDTHVAIWAAFDPEWISKDVLDLLNNANEVFVSTLSLAEIEMKKARGKIKMKKISSSDLDQIGLKILPFEIDAVHSISRFRQLANHDPFDWLLLAHAASVDAKFITADRKLLSLGLDWVIDAEA